MPVEVKQFSGVLDTDSSNETILPQSVKMARNVVYRNGRYETMKGFRQIANNLPVGINECIGAFYDVKKKRIYFFNYNSLGNHGIYVFYVRTESFDKVAVVGYNTSGDIFDFDLDGTIYNVKMIYGDDTQGDILYFNNSQKQPCAINVTRALTGSYGTIERSFIDVAKEPPSIPPYVVYENDNTVTVNNFRKRLVKIRLRNWFGNKEKSVTSTQSELPLPINYIDSDIDKDPTKNCRVAIVIPTGGPEVKKLEILASFSGTQKDGQSLPNQFGDPVSVIVLDKATLSIPDNDLYTFRWYNDQAYVPIDAKEAAQLQDLVPLEANALELLNGNVPVYGGIKENYNPVTVSGSITSTSISQRTTQYPFIFATNQSGDTGFGTGNIHAVVIGQITIGQTYTIFTTNQTITYTALVGTTTAVINGLAAAAIVAGFTVVSSDTENLYIVKTGESLLRSLVTNVILNVSDSFVYDLNSKYSYALIYFDEKGRTCGAVTATALSFSTVNYTETGITPNIPKVNLSISHRPPLEATYYDIVRSLNLSKSRFLYWVTDRTYKDNKYAYIGIENLNTFIKENPSSKHLAYDFASNDRVRFLKVLSGSVNTIYTNQDFEVIAQVFSPEIQGITYPGQFLKIALPTTSSTFDFGTDDFFNYFIQVYTPNQSFAEGLDLYYEFGERYAIGNSGTSTRFHQGMLQNQSTDLVTPATFEFIKGDDYYRSRTINTGGELDYIITAGSRGAGRHTMGIQFQDRTFVDSNILTGNSPLQNLSGFNLSTNNDRWFIKIGTGTYTFRIKGTIQFDPQKPDVGDFRLMDNLGNITYLYQSGGTFTPPTFPQTLPTAVGGFTDQNQTISFDKTFTLTSGQKIFMFFWAANDQDNEKVYYQTDFTVTVIKEYTVNIIDRNFSDYFESAVNSNGRAWIVDPNAGQVYNPTLIRWGLDYEVNTNLNRTNRFYDLNFDEVDRSKGDIRRFRVIEMIIRIFQDNAVCQKGIFGKFIQDSGGTNILTTTDDILTKNNANYYQGVYGIGDYPTNLISSTSADYFIYPATGEQIRLAGDGFTPISRLYYGKYYIKGLLSKYNKLWTRLNGSQAKIFGAFDYVEGDCVTILQGGINGSQTIDNYAFGFNESRNAYHYFADWLNPDWVLSVDDKMAFWKNGQLYLNDNTTKYCNFFGTQYYPSVLPVFNQDILVKKNYMATAYQSNKVWASDTNGDIKTSMINPQTGLQQISHLKEVDYEVSDNIRYAALLRDANSMADSRLALLEGDFLNGNWLSINYIYKGSDFAYFFAPYVSQIALPRNL